jgi:gamma-glutamylcyclotransferase (GGCT)/AIG2-like uncharacterized protein YtfP
MIQQVEFDLTSLRRLNELRVGRPCPELEALEHDFERVHGTGSRLAVYGTLAPGRSNHDQVEALGGRWQSGYSVRGVLFETGWGAEQGYPALRWSMAGAEVSVELLVSEQLPQHWDRLDAFEGPGYRRILVPLLRRDRVVEIANLYESTADPEDFA